MIVDLYNLKNEKVGTMEAPDSVFDVAWKPALVHQVVTAHRANQRKPWAHAKGRSEVRGGGRKPWRQKGTGRARHGSTRSPIWKGGGKAHGPINERDYSQKVNKKMRRVALFSVLSKKLKQGEVKFFENFELSAPKTALLAAMLRGALQLKKNSKAYDALLIPDVENKKVFRAAANLQKTLAVHPESLNVYDLLNHKHVFIDQKAVPVIEAHYKVNSK